MTGSAKKRKRLQPGRTRAPRLVRRISEERILQLANDLAENIASGDVKEWRSVAQYFQNALMKSEQKMAEIQPSLAALHCGRSLFRHALDEIGRWMDNHYPPNDKLS